MCFKREQDRVNRMNFQEVTAMIKSGLTLVRITDLSYLSLLNQMTLFITCTKYIYRLYGSPPTNFYGGSPYNFFQSIITI